MTVRLIFDATMVKPGQAGIRTYALGLARALAARDDVDLTVLTAANNADDWGGARVYPTALQRQGPYARATWRRVRLPKLLAAMDADGLLVPAPEPVRSVSMVQGMVIHDLGPLMAPGVYGWRRFLSYALTVPRSVRNVELIFTPTDATRLDLVRWTGDLGRSIVVAGPKLARPASARPMNSAIKRDFALYVGSSLPHKNLRTVIDAFRNPRPGMPTELLIAGPDYAGEVARLLTETSTLSNVKHLGFVAPEVLEELYQAARVVVFPSVFEGFGLPLLEALEHGTPVLASDIPALREVGRGRATFVHQPLKPESWAEALSTDPDVSHPDDGGLAMSWETCADAVVNAFDSAIAENVRS